MDETKSAAVLPQRCPIAPAAIAPTAIPRKTDANVKRCRSAGTGKVAAVSQGQL